MDWKEYEEITKHIYETIGKQNGVEIIGYGNNCKVKGKSGVEHQVDVLAKHSDGLHSYKTAIECKYWDKSINKDIVMKVAEIVEDSHLNKGVIVSKLGFTPNALNFAKYKNIGLIELREIKDEDWESRIKDIVIELNAQTAEIIGVELIVDPDTPSNLQQGSHAVGSLSVQFPHGKIKKFADFVKEFQSEIYCKNEDEEFEKVYSLEKGSVIIYEPTGDRTPINGLKFKGALRISRDTIEIKGADHIWLIMKVIFENKTYTVTKDKEIRERHD